MLAMTPAKLTVKANLPANGIFVLSRQKKTTNHRKAALHWIMYQLDLSIHNNISPHYRQVCLYEPGGEVEGENEAVSSQGLLSILKIV